MCHAVLVVGRLAAEAKARGGGGGGGGGDGSQITTGAQKEEGKRALSAEWGKGGKKGNGKKYLFPSFFVKKKLYFLGGKLI